MTQKCDLNAHARTPAPVYTQKDTREHTLNEAHAHTLRRPDWGSDSGLEFGVAILFTSVNINPSDGRIFFLFNYLDFYVLFFSFAFLRNFLKNKCQLKSCSVNCSVNYSVKSSVIYSVNLFSVKS